MFTTIAPLLTTFEDDAFEFIDGEPLDSPSDFETMLDLSSLKQSYDSYVYDNELSGLENVFDIAGFLSTDYLFEFNNYALV